MTTTIKEKDLQIRSLKLSIGGFKLKTEEKEKFAELP